MISDPDSDFRKQMNDGWREYLFSRKEIGQYDSGQDHFKLRKEHLQD